MKIYNCNPFLFDFYYHIGMAQSGIFTTIKNAIEGADATIADCYYKSAAHKVIIF